MSRRLGVALFLLIGCLVSCQVSEAPEPLPLEVEVLVVGSSTLAGLERARLAAVWTQDGRFEVGSDLALTATGAVVRLNIGPNPPGFTPFPPEPFDLITANGYLPNAFRPRLVVYSDQDDSGTLGVGSEGRIEPDLLIGIDLGSRLFQPQGSVAVIQNFERLFELMSLEDVDRFYQMTGGRFTPVVRVLSLPLLGRSIETFGAQILLIPDPNPAPIQVHLGLEGAGAELLCLRSLREGATREEIHVIVDRAIDPIGVCGLGSLKCDSLDLNLLEPPAALLGSDLKSCNRGLGLEVLVVEGSTRRCSAVNCACVRTVEVEAFVIRTSSASPAWWPCGDEVPYCEATGPSVRIDPSCPTDG